MTLYQGALDSDGNRRAVGGYLPFVSHSLWTFSAATTGAQGTHVVFNVTGDILFDVFATVRTDLTGASAVVGLGNTSNPNAIVGNTTATDCDAGLVLAAGGAGSPSTLGLMNVATYVNMYLLSGTSQDVCLRVGTADVTGGALDIYCLWKPLRDGSDVTVATPA